MSDAENPLINDRYDLEITMPLAVLTLMADPLPCPEENIGIDPYNTGCLEVAKTWPSRARK